MTKYAINDELNGIEIYFDEKPKREIIDTLKSNRWRWHNRKKCWYTKNNADAVALAESVAKGKMESIPTKQKQQNNKYGVVVGDVFSASWGYDQTNVDFFQVIALVGAESVRVREVYLPVISERPTCSMAADYEYKVVREILPAATHSVFIKDQENGDVKRVKPGFCKDEAEANKNCRFRISSYADAYKVNGDTTTEYVSWYA